MKCTKEQRLSYTEQAKAIVEKLTLEQKVSLMGGNVTLAFMLEEMERNPNAHYNHFPYDAGGSAELNIPPVKFCDGPRGVVCGKGETTCFPVSMCRGATFDTELEYQIGQAIGEECRAFGGNLFAGICVNLPYHPGWGRSQETYGEESFHLGEMGKALMLGVQDKNVIGCVKHYAFNQMEISRFKVSVDCDKRTEREVFLPHFKKIIEAGAGCVMSSYNLYDGVHCGHHKYLLTDVLKGEWDFDGFVMSDFGWGIRDTVEAANGGQDLEMCDTHWFGERLVKAVQDDFVPESRVDDAAVRIVRTLLAFEAADNGPLNQQVLASAAHIALARRAAEEGITLLQNKNHVLPLSRKETKDILILGKLGEKENIGDHGSSQVFPPYVVTPLQGIANAASKSNVTYYSGANLAHARALAARADAVVFVLGYDYDDEGEFVAEDPNENYTGSAGGDRTQSLGLHPDELALIKNVGPVNSNSAVVLIGGNMILMEEWKDCVSSILMAYYPGMEGGTALGEILFGDVNPSGKLPYVQVKQERDLPSIRWDSRYQHYDYYHGYTKLEKEGIEPALPYGFGLSYTTFKLDDPQFFADETRITASVVVTNTGTVSGTEVIQLYIGFENSKVDRPIKQLRGFQRVTLQPGEAKKVTISCPAEELTWYDPNRMEYILDHMGYSVYIGTSSANSDLLHGTVSL